MLEIRELLKEELEERYQELIELQYQNTCLHFPHKNIDIEKHVKPVIDEIKQYMEGQKAYIFIAVYEEKMIGFLWCYPRMFFDESRIYINSLIINEKYRGKGIGQKLMDRAEEKAKELKSDAIYVSTASFNEGAQAFYRKQGYIDERVQLCKKIVK